MLDIEALSFSRAPSIWWPEDRAWCVATEMDVTETLVGGREACIEQILRQPELETLPITLDGLVDYKGDTINPTVDPNSAETAVS